MRGTNVVGIIFSNMHDDYLPQLTSARTMGSVPFGGRYRTIDFPLSNMVNSNISKVGVVTKSNYQSLMDHLGSGKAWDLSRKKEGLYILPPFGRGNGLYNDRIEALAGISNFLKHCSEEYVVMSDCHIVYNINFKDVLNAHVEKKADITVLYKNGVIPAALPNKVTFELNRSKKITAVVNGIAPEGKCNWSMGVYVMNREFLMRVVEEAVAKNKNSFIRDVLQNGVDEYKICGYKHEGYAGVLSSAQAYFAATMDMMKADVRRDLFNPMRPIYTKVRDEMPARYGLTSSVKNSMIADGCIIEGEVENCVLFRGVKIGKGAKVSNCIIMQNTEIGDNTVMNYVIADKDVIVRNGRSFMGCESYPVYIGKGNIV